MNLLSMSAQQLARAIRAGHSTSLQAVRAHIAHMQLVNPRINAVVQTRFSEALAEAKAADARIAAGEANLPPLLGVPCSIKENFQLTGFRQVSGMVARAGVVSAQDAPTVARLRAAGAIVLGSTNTPELCMWMETHNRVYGRTRNPYHAGHIVGGSSGGEGAIVGSGAVPFGLGADVGGSIRFPAFFNGVFGHKPTPGIVPNTGQFPLPKGLMNERCVTGPICRRAEDLWPLMRILAGGDGIDPIAGRSALDGDPARVRIDRLRVIAIPDNGKTQVDPELAAAQRKAAAALAAMGAEVTTQRIPALKQDFVMWSAAMKAAQPEAFATSLGQGKPISVAGQLLRWSVGRSPHTLPALVLAGIEKLPAPTAPGLRALAALRAQLLQLLGDDGVLLYPPYPRPAPRHNWPMLRPFDFAYSGIVNALGFPATAVPLGLSSKGLPLGLQVIAAPGRDAQCVAVALALERAMGGWVMPKGQR